MDYHVSSFDLLWKGAIVQQGRSRTALTRVRALLVAVGFVLVGIVGVATPASASIQPALCSGYAACVAAGYTDHGYGANNGNQYWHEFAGDNCTNYAAFLQVQNGFSTQTQYSPGDAANWGTYFSSYENSTPAVGSIAWWGGSQGDHVAYVESIAYNPDGSVSSFTASEDNWGGSFDWRVYLASDSANWPSGFLHFKDTATTPVPTTLSWNGVGNATFLGSDSIPTGGTMSGNQYILSSDGRFVLMMQTDGNLVEYTSTGVIWQSHTSNHPGAYLAVQSDGNIVIYDANGVTPLWSAGTTNAIKLAIQPDADVVAYASGDQGVWASGVTTSTDGLNYRSDNLTTGMTMVKLQYLRSSDRRYFALVQPDGNMVVYAPGQRVIWNSGTSGHPGAYLAVQSDGNIVIYDANGVTPLWSAGTTNAIKLAIQSDGNFVAYNASDVPVWASGTAGQL